MKANWEKHREAFTQQSIERYARMKAEGSGLLSEQAEARKREAAAWIMKKAARALHAETNYNEVYAEAQARIREEQPFNHSDDYYEYLKWLGHETVNSPECRELADSFMSDAIPRFASAWRKKRGAGQQEALTTYEESER